MKRTIPIIAISIKEIIDNIYQLLLRGRIGQLQMSYIVETKK
ncbi:MAG TPA: hypothetical protein VFU05_16660 [Cyclobacteriaceae bacterium]|nr:hypothetical protein [Cyclobacteriaceae bacterium]